MPDGVRVLVAKAMSSAPQKEEALDWSVSADKRYVLIVDTNTITLLNVKLLISFM